jgi:hypothetical protein
MDAVKFEIRPLPFEGVIPKRGAVQPGEGYSVDKGMRVREIPSASLRAGSSLRLKSGSAQDGATKGNPN